MSQIQKQPRGSAAPPDAAPRRSLGTRTEVADYLGVSPQTLDKWAYQGTGPRFRKIGKHARYSWQDVDTWVSSQPCGGSPDDDLPTASATRALPRPRSSIPRRRAG